MSLKVETNRFSERYTDLASRRLGGQTLSCSDDFFAEMENLLKPGRGVFIDDKYTELAIKVLHDAFELDKN